jgi:spore coat protein U-like protein
MKRSSAAWVSWMRGGGLALALVAGLAPGLALAGTATTTFTVTATVLAVCAVQTTNLSFSSYSASTGTATTATSSVTATCSNGSPYTIALDAGQATAATVANRSMTFGAQKLSYGLYTTAGYSTFWGDGTLSTATVGATGNAALRTHTVYGQIPAGQYVTAGGYTDTVTVTVSY